MTMKTNLNTKYQSKHKKNHKFVGLPVGLSNDWFTRIIKLGPRLLLALLLLPVLGGALSMILPAFGYIPGLEQTQWGLVGFKKLFHVPGLGQMVWLSLLTGFVSTLLSVVLTMMILAAFFKSAKLAQIQRLLSPILVIPHAAAAIAIGFLIAPSGMMSRLISPWLTEWTLAPSGMFPHDPYGISIILGLTLKELPFLLLMALGVIAQPELGKRLSQQHNVALSLGYWPMTAFIKVVFPSIYPLMRLPILAVLAYASSSVEMPLILGPNTPSTLAVAIMHWFNDVDLTMRVQASAGALLQLLTTAGLILFWLFGERIVAACWCKNLSNGSRNYGDAIWRKATQFITILLITFLVLALVGLLLWSIAGLWRFPDTIPNQLTFNHFDRALEQLNQPILNTLIIGAMATFIAVSLTLICLEYEQLTMKSISPVTRVVIYLPLVVPSISFLYGLVWMQQKIQVQNELLSVTFAHLLFVLPYVFLSLASSYRQLDPRLTSVALSLGAKPIKVFFQVKLPQLFTPILISIALGLAISFGQYLPTLIAGGGRVATITTEAVALANGASRRTSAVYAVIQMVLPLMAFALAWMLPKFFFKQVHR